MLANAYPVLVQGPTIPHPADFEQTLTNTCSTNGFPVDKVEVSEGDKNGNIRSLLVIFMMSANIMPELHDDDHPFTIAVNAVNDWADQTSPKWQIKVRDISGQSGDYAVFEGMPW